MARVRHVQIRNFRGVASLDWWPSPGVNCLIGPGDSGKSTILDAIDLCLGARKNAQFNDTDFHGIDASQPIWIAVTVGGLPDRMRTMEAYGPFLRGFDPATGAVEDEPAVGGDVLLTLTLTVGADLEPAWLLYSDRGAAQGLTRNLNWPDRVALAPTRLGGAGDANLSWRRGSVLNRLSDERADATAALIAASRDARDAFGDQADEQLAATLAVVNKVVGDLGLPVQGGAHALLDARSISLSGGTVSLHDRRGVPLSGLGVGSSRLLVAGLQREAASTAEIVLVDEIEHGLEPHRIIGLLGSLGAKEASPPLQVFATTHSPVAVRELSAVQLHVVRVSGGVHQVVTAGSAGDVQGTIRVYPEAFLAPKVIVCEGASEVGLLRGIDIHLTRNGLALSLAARGVALVDAKGVGNIYPRAKAFVSLGYRVAVLRDDDVQPPPETEAAFTAGGGHLAKWRPHHALEDDLFASLPDAAVAQMVERAVDLLGQSMIDDHIKSASMGTMGLHNPKLLLEGPGRLVLAKASRRGSWFKSVTRMEDVAADIVAPNLVEADTAFKSILDRLFQWMG